MTDNLIQQAISAALAQDWTEAVEFNEQIVKTNPNDIEALNRLGRAYMELGKPEAAKKFFNKVLKIDLYNQIAQKNLVTLSSKKSLKGNNKTPLNPNLFLEDPGKTKTTSLVEITNRDVVISLSVGDQINLVPKKRAIVVTNEKEIYLGKLPDDLSIRLISFLKGGNKYQVNIKSAEPNEIKIFIREVFRSKKFASLSSFPPQEIAYSAFVPPDLVHDTRPEMADTDGEERTNEEDGEIKPESTEEEPLEPNLEE
jgi:tetratricopeptide (TPR) repeat protein